MKGTDLFLRALEPTDVDLLYQWENDPSIWHLGSTIVPFSRFQLEQYVLSADQDIFTARQLRLMIVLRDTKGGNLPVGLIDLFEFDPVNSRAGIGILIRNEERGKGYASKALELIIDYAFKTLNLHQLYCNITVDNNSSLSLFKKHGFTISGTKKEWVKYKKEWLDEYILQLINNEF